MSEDKKEVVENSKSNNYFKNVFFVVGGVLLFVVILLFAFGKSDSNDVVKDTVNDNLEESGTTLVFISIGSFIVLGIILFLFNRKEVQPFEGVLRSDLSIEEGISILKQGLIHSWGLSVPDFSIQCPQGVFNNDDEKWLNVEVKFYESVHKRGILDGDIKVFNCPLSRGKNNVWMDKSEAPVKTLGEYIRSPKQFVNYLSLGKSQSRKAAEINAEMFKSFAENTDPDSLSRAALINQFMSPNQVAVTDQSNQTVEGAKE